jgi:hypothetical protein
MLLVSLPHLEVRKSLILRRRAGPDADNSSHNNCTIGYIDASSYFMSYQAAINKATNLGME